MISEGLESSFIFLPNQLRLFIRRRNCLEDLKQGTTRHSDIEWTLQITQKFRFAESNSICVWKGKATQLCKRIFVLAVLFLLLENFFRPCEIDRFSSGDLERGTSVQKISQCVGTCMHTHTHTHRETFHLQLYQSFTGLGRLPERSAIGDQMTWWRVRGDSGGHSRGQTSTSTPH